MLVRLPPIHLHPAGYTSPWEQPRWMSRGHEWLVQPHKQSPGSQDGSGKLNLRSKTQHGMFFYFCCIICESTEKMHTLISKQIHTTHSACTAAFPWEKERESVRERKRAREDGDLGQAFNEMENSRKSVSTPHSAVSKLHYTLSAWIWWGDSQMCVCVWYVRDRLAIFP